VLERYGQPDKPTYVGRYRNAQTTYEHKKQIEDMVHAILEDREPRVNGEAGRRSVEILRGIYYSAITGRQIQLPMTIPDETPYPAV
jgi:predicted dehydrogenase